MKSFTRLIAAGLLVMAVCVAPAAAQSVGLVSPTTTTLRAAAITTNLDVASTCFAVDGRDVAYVCPVWVTLGSATNILLSPGGSVDGTTATTSLNYNPSKTVTITTSGAFLLRWPKEDFCAAPTAEGVPPYAAVFTKATGSPTGTAVTIQMAREKF